jgi:pilus assembly protein Flp/PilA
MESIRNFWQDESGATAVEYGLLVALIACVVISTVTSLGNGLKNKFNIVATAIGTGS